MLPCLILLLALLMLTVAAPAALAADPDFELGTGLGSGLGPLARTPDNLRIYNDCMRLARSEPLKALPMAEKWIADGGSLGARHCVAIAMFESGRYIEAATRLEAIARDMGQERPGLRAELYAQAGQAWMDAGQAENAAAAQSSALGFDHGSSSKPAGVLPGTVASHSRPLRVVKCRGLAVDRDVYCVGCAGGVRFAGEEG